MQRDLRQAIKADWYDTRADTARGVAGHPAIGPRPRDDPSRHHAAANYRHATGQADLATMSMAAEHQVETRMRRLPIDLRRMRHQDRTFAGWNLGGCLLDVVGTEIMRIVDPGDMDCLIAALNRHGFVDQHADSEPLQVDDRTDRVVIAESAVDRTLERRKHLRQPNEDVVGGIEFLVAVITGQHAEIV